MNLLSIENRQALSRDKTLGAGNFIFKLSPSFKEVTEPLIYLDQPLKLPDGAHTITLSFQALLSSVKLLASWYHSYCQVSPKKLVGVYIENSFQTILHYLALTSLGAVPVLINSAMSLDAMVTFSQQATIDLLLINSPFKNNRTLAKLHNTTKVVTLEEILIKALSLPEEYPYHHQDDDPVLITHTSGTTGFPKPVVMRHQGFFYGIRDFLNNPPNFLPKDHSGTDGAPPKMLSLLPTAHNAAIAYFMRAMVSHMPFCVIAEQSLNALLQGIERFQPNIVVAFPHYFVRLTQHLAELSSSALDSVDTWISTGDASHQTHIRQLIRFRKQRLDGLMVAGSTYIDCLGSSEMGSSLFRQTHSVFQQTNLRCVGHALSWVDTRLLGDYEETIYQYDQVGKLAVSAKSVTSGYWNQPTLNAHFRRGERLLTGDRMYRDRSGHYYQVDRLTDTISCHNGYKIYSVLTEEVILNYLPTLLDCVVIGGRNKLGRQETLVLFIPHGNLTANHQATPLLSSANKVLTTYGLPCIDRGILTTLDELPIGITGKVLKRQLREYYFNE